jgi:hypothetical protein
MIMIRVMSKKNAFLIFRFISDHPEAFVDTGFESVFMIISVHQMAYYFLLDINKTTPPTPITATPTSGDQ